MVKTETLELYFSLTPEDELSTAITKQTIKIEYLADQDLPDNVFARIEADTNSEAILWCGYGKNKFEAACNAILGSLGYGGSHNLLTAYYAGVLSIEDLADYLRCSMKEVWQLINQACSEASKHPNKKQQILALLSDGLPHSADELIPITHRFGATIYDLKKEGYLIATIRLEDGKPVYQMEKQRLS